MSIGHLIVNEEVLDTMRPECKHLFECFVNKGEVVSLDRNRDRCYNYLLDHPDFDAVRYGEDAEYMLHYTRELDEGHNAKYVISKLSVWTGGYKVEAVKYYGDKDGITYGE